MILCFENWSLTNLGWGDVTGHLELMIRILLNAQNCFGGSAPSIHPSIHSQKTCKHRRLKAENGSLDGKKLRFVFKPLASIKAVESPQKAREKKTSRMRWNSYCFCGSFISCKVLVISVCPMSCAVACTKTLGEISLFSGWLLILSTRLVKRPSTAWTIPKFYQNKLTQIDPFTE